MNKSALSAGLLATEHHSDVETTVVRGFHTLRAAILYKIYTAVVQKAALESNAVK